MSDVYIVQVQGWGDDEDAMENISVHSTMQLAEAAIKRIVAEAEADGLEDVVTDIQIFKMDA